MKIACDVLYTLVKGERNEQVLAILKMFIEEGYEVTVWSSDYSMAKKAVKDLDIRGKDGNYIYFTDKYAQYDARDRNLPVFDLAIDDDTTQFKYLAAKTFIPVYKIPATIEEALEYARNVIKEIESKKALYEQGN